MKKTVLIFSCLIIALLILFQLSTYSYLSGTASIEIILAIIAITFFFIGIYINKKNNRPINTSSHQINSDKIKTLGLSPREYEVLVQISKGLSNKEIASLLFLSESTVKTPTSNLFSKLDAKRRTQAIKKAQELQILAN